MGAESVRVSPKLPIERVACRVYLSADQDNLTDGVWTKVLLDTREYDLGSSFDITGNNRFDVPVTGLYGIRVKADFNDVIANKGYEVSIYVNGSSVLHHHDHTGGATDDVDVYLYDEFYLNKGDYIELYVVSNAGVNTVDITGGSEFTFMGVRLITKEGSRQ